MIEDEDSVFNSLFTLIEKSDNQDDKEVTFLDSKENIKDYSLKEVNSSANVLIDAFCGLTKEKEFFNKKH